MSGREGDLGLALMLVGQAGGQSTRGLLNVVRDAPDFIQFARHRETVEPAHAQRHGVHGALAHDLYNAVARFAQGKGIVCDIRVFLHQVKDASPCAQGVGQGQDCRDGRRLRGTEHSQPL
jgi:hypothetical protein